MLRKKIFIEKLFGSYQSNGSIEIIKVFLQTWISILKVYNVLSLVTSHNLKFRKPCNSSKKIILGYFLQGYATPYQDFTILQQRVLNPLGVWVVTHQLETHALYITQAIKHVKIT